MFYKDTFDSFQFKRKRKNFADESEEISSGDGFLSFSGCGHGYGSQSGSIFFECSSNGIGGGYSPGSGYTDKCGYGDIPGYSDTDLEGEG